MPHPELAIRPGQVFSVQVLDKYWTSIGQVLGKCAVDKCAVDKYAEAEVELDHDDGALVGIGEHDGRL